MKKIHCIIPTFDRAAQLDLLLRSIGKNARDLFKLYFIIRSSSLDHLSTYTYERCVVEQYYQSSLYESDKNSFKDNMLKHINVIEKSDDDLMCFLMDDDVIFRLLPRIEFFKEVFADNDIGTFSLRLGLNTDLQTYYDPNSYINMNNIAFGEMKTNYGRYIICSPSHAGNNNFGYPFSLDGNIFRKQDLIPLLKQLNYNNPNELESALSSQPFNRFMGFFPKNCLCSIVANSVSNWNQAGRKHPHSSNELLYKYLDNKKINMSDVLEQLHNTCNCTHTELEFKFDG